MIRFLIKSAIWLSLAFMVMPHFFPADQENTSTKNSAPVQTKAEPDSIDQLLNNGKTALELGKLCVNNPALCENGASVLSSAASGVLERSGGVLEYLSDRFGTKPQTAEQPTKSLLHAIPIPTPRAEALRALDHSSTGAIPARK
jgi:hypothetical protein